MTSTLPKRPYAVLSPPDDGLSLVRREAGRRRRRKAVAAAGGGLGAVAIAAALALSASGAGLAVLKPVPPAGPGLGQPSPTPTSSSTVSSPKHRRAGDHSATAPHAQAHGRVATTDAGTPRSTAGLHPAAVPTTGDNTSQAGSAGPRLVRWQSTYTGPTRECSGSTYGNGSGSIQNSVGWCTDATATRVSGGVRLHFEVCRDTTGGGTLNFLSTREVDLVVREGARTVWDWAKLQPGSSSRHQLSAAANGCWNWSLVWPDVAQDGSAAGHGDFTFDATSTAQEMQGAPTRSATFSY